jgi:hypothetical protein
MADERQFTFEISLSVLNHLGRNLYRSFITVLGEAVSNSWDADAENVWIYIDRDKNYLVIKDDGDGMTADDFQNKFLKIGYTKRKYGKTKSAKDRPYIGRKGIGKLALLSCADKISVISKKENGEYVGGTIDNSGLDRAINKDLTPQEYPLGNWEKSIFEPYIEDHQKGTIVYFENIKDGIRNTVDYLKKSIALYFRFSLLDDSFNLFLNDEPITIECLDDLASKTQFIWLINDIQDPYIQRLKEKFPPLEEGEFAVEDHFTGFIATVEKPRNLSIISSDERVGIDLFVNGRLRERNILKQIPTSRIVENYLYGQIHFNELDDSKDRFATAREGIVANDPKFERLLKKLQNQIINKVIEDWDKWRVKHRMDGDSENMRIKKRDRISKRLFDVVSEEYTTPPGGDVPPSGDSIIPPDDTDYRERVENWVNDLGEDAQFNFGSYAECFISENLIRKFIQENSIALSSEAQTERKKWQGVETDSKNKGNISIDIRRVGGDLSYLSMNSLAYLVDKKDPIKEACLARDANEYKPIRDAIAHTALLTDVAKSKLTSVYENIKGRIRTLLSGGN